MSRFRRWLIRVALASVSCTAVVMWVGAAVSPATPVVKVSLPVTSGQSATLLTDGEWLLLGGYTPRGGVTGQVQLVEPVLRHRNVLKQGLNVPRARQTATVLPDGTVLIIGGVGAFGQLVSDVERYDPRTRRFENLGDIGLPALKGQSATLLTDGRLLIAGGTDVSSLVGNEVELLDATTMNITSGGTLAKARTGQQAELLPDGNVLIWGGTNQTGEPITTAEVYDTATGESTVIDGAHFARLLSEDETPAAPTVQATLPQAGSTGVAVDSRFSVRFSKPLNPATVTDRTVTLFGPAGVVPTRVVAAEGGRIAFVTPDEPLFPGSHYTLFIRGLGDRAAQVVPFTAVGFDTAIIAPSSAVRSPVLQVRRPTPTPLATESGMWIPAKQNLTGVWRSGRAYLARQHMPRRDSVARALYGIGVKNGLPEARPGVTAVAGQVLELNGVPLAQVTLSIGSKSVETDRNGEFLLSGVPSGTQVLVIDGSTADQGVRQYGRYEYRAMLQPAKTNSLPFVIWMTRLDTRHAVTIPSPTTSETVVTNPYIPGLELRIPPGTVIRDSQGNIVTKISITPIPVDQPPFPLPNHDVPVYFTIQPGGARLESLSSKSAQGAQLIYPNFQRSPPGTRIDFWNYDPTEKGWYIYGQGTVSRDDKQIIPDPGVAIYEFTGAMVASSGYAPGFGPVAGGCGATAGDPVDCFTGLYVLKRTDLYVRDVIPIEVQRTYRPMDPASRAFGIGTNLGYDLFMVGDTNPYTYQDLILPDGSRIHFARISSGTSYYDAVYRTQTPGPFFGSTISWNGAANAAWVLQLPNGTAYDFPDSEGAMSARGSAAMGMQDRDGNALTFVRGSNSNLTSITSPNGRSITFTYDTSNRITQATDNTGRSVTYGYDSGGRLVSVTDPAGNTESYTYDSSNDLLTITDKRRNVVLTNTYDSSGRVSNQTYGDGSSSTFNYTVNSSGVVTAMTYTDSRGSVKQVEFNSSGYPTSVARALGTSNQETTTYVRDPNTNLATSVTDALGRETTYQYNSYGSITQATYLSGTSNATSWAFTYGPYDELASLTDPEGHTETLTYDSSGNLVTATDAIGDSEALGYDSEGRVTSISRYVNGTPLTTTLTYFGGDLASVTDPLGHETQFYTDALGRTITVVDPLGNRSPIVYDALDRVTETVDPLGGTLKYGYDANGNLTSFTDARSNVTSFAYDKMNRRTSMTDPLNQTENYSYDGDGNLVQVIDRKGQVMGFAYDLLDRRTSAGFGATTAEPTNYVSTIDYTWDAGNRLTQAVDTASGTITRAYDGLDELTQEQTPQGEIAYAYYSNGLRSSTTVQGQTTVNYSYDGADRLTEISQGSSSVSIVYDTADRRTSVTLPNGVQMAYSYDGANEITGIAYANGGTSLGNLTYSYDADGRRVGTGGSLAQVVLPAAVSSASYDAANRLTSWGSDSLSYDADGNLTSYGSSTYTWNARNQLVATSDGNSSFSYGAFGRRTTKTVGGTETTYLYDGENPVLVNGDFMLAGPGLDEYYAQISSSGTTSLLRDALGNVLALTDGTGAIAGSYSYEPYGAATQSGSTTASFQFTGRENDGTTGLYYFRARYYSPTLGRFISQDPLELRAGPNGYAYAAGDPISRRDPSGEISIPFDPAGVPPGMLNGALSTGIDAGMNGGDPSSAATTGAITGGLTGGFTGPAGVVASGAVGAATAPPGGGLPGGLSGAAGAALPGESAIPFGVVAAMTAWAEKGISDLAAMIRCIGGKN